MIDSEERRNGISPAYAGTNAGIGLTKRELFAAMAMNGIFASDVSNENTTEQVVEWSIHAADTLLAELAKEKTE